MASPIRTLEEFIQILISQPKPLIIAITEEHVHELVDAIMRPFMITDLTDEKKSRPSIYIAGTESIKKVMDHADDTTIIISPLYSAKNATPKNIPITIQPHEKKITIPIYHAWITPQNQKYIQKY